MAAELVKLNGLSLADALSLDIASAPPPQGHAPCMSVVSTPVPPLALPLQTAALCRADAGGANGAAQATGLDGILNTLWNHCEMLSGGTEVLSQESDSTPEAMAKVAALRSGVAIGGGDLGGGSESEMEEEEESSGVADILQHDLRHSNVDECLDYCYRQECVSLDRAAADVDAANAQAHAQTLWLTLLEVWLWQEL